MADSPEIVDAPQAHRWEARLDGSLAGFAQYTLRPGLIVFTHTEVDPAFEGRGIAGALARTSLDAARAAGLGVVPLCPFYAAWIKKHPDYQDLVRELPQ
jgi:predicted GNAT family acetyltransferase